MWQENQKDAAFTLLEILVALMVLAISYAALSQTISASLLQARAGADLMKAAELAKRLSVEVNGGDGLVNKGVDGKSGLEWDIVTRSIAATPSTDWPDYSFKTIRIRRPGTTADLFALRFIVKSSDKP